MNRLQREVQRLYLPGAAEPLTTETTQADLVDAAGQVRAMVLGLARPADWQVLVPAWQGVQADLGWPAPAIAVAGDAGYQLWFSLAQPVPVAQAAALLDALRVRYLGEVDARRVTPLPALDVASPQGVRHALPVPAPLAGTGQWSAFVAPDLAPVFSAETWLELPPNPEGQASLLARLASIAADEFAHALDLLMPADALSSAAPGMADAVACAPPMPATGPVTDPRRFLLEVMNNDAVALELRIEAAKALLPYAAGRGGS